MKTIEFTWKDGTKTEVKSERKLTKTKIAEYINNALATGNVVEIKIK